MRERPKGRSSARPKLRENLPEVAGKADSLREDNKRPEEDAKEAANSEA